MKWFPRCLYLLNRLRYQITRPVTIGVRLLLIHDDKVLLVKHTYQRHWYLPGGGVKRSETLEDAARREAREEIGAILGPLRLFGVYTNFYEAKSDHVVVFVSDPITLTGQIDDHEIEHFAWFAPEALPEGTSPGSRRRIVEYTQSPTAPLVGLW
ncbi:MAG: NUDIX domain-containing protein [Anaerolineae bacterium]|nr:NUDIX domain-containing protein [Anaerolineae bacterium]